MSKIKLLFAFYFLIIIALFLYSYTQVDLSLTLSRVSIWQAIEKAFQYIGYFNRPASTYLYVSITALLSIFYLIFLRLSSKGVLSNRQLWTIIMLMAVILTFSYNAFSYDLFNYIFDAKIITHYHQNPYMHKALDFTSDPMLSFMHWTHRIYPYGPFWLFLTVPLSFLGFGFFLPTFFLFKTLATLSYLGTSYYIGKILQKTAKDKAVFGTLLFALNPLVIIECLVSSHNDIVMMFFLVMAFYFLLIQKKITSGALFILSIGVKFATLFVLPVFLIHFISQKLKKNVSQETIFLLSFVLMSIAIIVASKRETFQVWYFLYVLPIASLLPKKRFIAVFSVIVSIFSLLSYVPFLYLGNYNPPVPTILFSITFGSILLGIFCSIIFEIKNRRFLNDRITK